MEALLVDNAGLIGALAGVVAIIGGIAATIKWGRAIFAPIRNLGYRRNQRGQHGRPKVEDKLALKRQLQKVFPHGSRFEVIIRSIDDDKYPKVDRKPEGGISSWFKAEFCDHYHDGIEVCLTARDAIVDGEGNWAMVDYFGDGEFDERVYDKINVFIIGKVPFRNIVEVDDLGDEYYGNSPHLYCKFADQGEPYEEVVYRPTGEGYQPDMPPGLQFAFKDRRRQ